MTREITELGNAMSLTSKAVMHLVLEDGDLRQRLARATQELSLVYAVPCQDGRTSVSAELAEDIAELYHRLTLRPSYATEGTITATIQLMSDGEVEQAARDLLEVSDRLHLEFELAHRS